MRRSCFKSVGAVVVVLIARCSSSFAQDSSRAPVLPLHLTFSGGHVYLSPIGESRSAFSPLWHGSTYLDVQAAMRPAAGVSIWASVYGEHRGFSYGVLNTREMIVVPYVNAALDTAFSIGGEPFRAHASVGTERDLRMHEGLMIYNIDAQGSEFFLQWRKLRITKHKIGDMLYSYGLAIDDFDDLYLSLEDWEFMPEWTVHATAGVFGVSRNDESDYTASVGVAHREVRLYAQVAARQSSVAESGYAWLAGVSDEIAAGPWHLRCRAEFRSYDAAFNRGLYGSALPMTDRSSTSPWSSSIGTTLYPIAFYNRPFSQWNAYTEWQGYNVHAVVAQLDASVRIVGMLFAFGSIDVNGILLGVPTTSRYDVVPSPPDESYYDVGLNLQPSPDVRFAASLTNKDMNLQGAYPGAFVNIGTTFKLAVVWNVTIAK